MKWVKPHIYFIFPCLITNGIEMLLTFINFNAQVHIDILSD